MTEMSILKGKVLGERVEVERQFETGGQAGLYMVKELDGGNRTLAAKLVVAPYNERHSANFVADFDSLNRELDILGDVSHRFIAKMLFRIDDLLEIDDERFVVRGFVMEHSPTGTLARYIANKDDFAPEDRVRVCHQLAEAVDELHNLNITHSDIKAENVILTLQNNKLVPVLIDFGAAFRGHEAWPGYCSEPYIAPELRNKSASASATTDIYSLGTLFAEILSGERLHQPAERSIEELNLLTIAEDTRQLLLRMIYHDTNIRPSISEVVSSFDERRSRIGTTNQLDKNKIRFPYGKFQWFDEVHRFLNSKKHLFLLRGTRPTIESDSLCKDLEKSGFFSPKIRRIVGDYDFMLEIWCQDAHFDRLNQICSEFNLHTTRSSTQPLYYELEQSEYVCSAQFDSAGFTPTSFIQKIQDVISSSPTSEVIDYWESSGFGRRIVECENTIDFTIFLKCNNELTSQAKLIYQGFVVQYLSKKLSDLGEGELKNRNVISLIRGSSDIIMSLCIKDYKNFATLLLGTMRELRSRRLEGSHEFSPKTFVDFDGRARFEGYDGSIPRMILESR